MWPLCRTGACTVVRFYAITTATTFWFLSVYFFPKLLSGSQAEPAIKRRACGVAGVGFFTGSFFLPNQWCQRTKAVNYEHYAFNALTLLATFVRNFLPTTSNVFLTRFSWGTQRNPRLPRKAVQIHTEASARMSKQKIDFTLMLVCQQNQRARDVTSSIETHYFCLHISTLSLQQTLSNNTQNVNTAK